MKQYAVMLLNAYKAICGKVRELLGITDTIKADELPEKITEVYESGKAQGTDEFWDLSQNYGNRTFYRDAFIEWGGEYIRPKYKVIPTESGGTIRVFLNCENLKKIEAQYFDFSQTPKTTSSAEGFYYTFAQCLNLAEIEDVGITNQKYLTRTFSGCVNLKKIARIYVAEDTIFNNTFSNCKSLEDVTFDGLIAQNGLSFSSSPLLTEATLRNIVGCLKDFREKIVEDFTVNILGSTISSSHTLVDGEKYTLTMVSDDGETETVSGTVGDVYVAAIGETKIGAEFTFSRIYEGEVSIAWVYQDGENLMFSMYFSRQNPKITLIKSPTEKHSITLGTSNLAKLTDVEKAIATQKGWTLS